MIGALAGFFAGGLFTPQTPIAPGVVPLARGDAYRDLVLPGLDGSIRRLSEWDGKPRVINFWASWCGPCVQEMPLFQALHRERGEQLHVIGIAIDDPEPVRRFVAELGVSYPILLDEPGPADASVQYGDTRGVLPYSVLIDAQGRIVAQRSGSFTRETLESWLARLE